MLKLYYSLKENPKKQLLRIPMVLFFGKQTMYFVLEYITTAEHVGKAGQLTVRAVLMGTKSCPKILNFSTMTSKIS